MKIFTHINAGARVAPVFIIFLYILFICLDSYTTWLATPDLQYEKNWVVRCLGLGWTAIIIKDIIIMLFMIIAFILSLEHIHRSFKNGIGRDKKTISGVIFLNWKMVISYIIIGSFYSDLISRGILSLNNYFGYEYLYSIRTCFSGISNYYIKNVMIGHPHFMLNLQFLFLIPGYIIAITTIARIRKKYRIPNLNR